MGIKIFFAVLCSVVVFPGDHVGAAVQLPAGFQEELVAYGLNLPTAAEYAPDGRLFLLEKGGRIRIIKNGKLLAEPFLNVEVNSLSERGLLGIAFDPDFATNHYIYIYRTTPDPDPRNQVERYTASGDIALAGSQKVLLEGIHSDAGFHNGGCLRFGPDGKLYISTGDGGLNPSFAQDKANLNGKILRINPDGSIPLDNPFAGQSGARGEVWAYGLRNPWRFAIHPVSGLMAIGEVGENIFEELNIGTAGANYGWPQTEGPTNNPSLTPPVYAYDHQTGGASIVAGFFYTGAGYPGKYRNVLFFTDYVRGFIKTIRLQSEPPSAQTFATGLNTPVHMFQSPDGSLLYVSFNRGEIRRLRFVGGRNRPPVAEAHSSRRAGPIPLIVHFSAIGTVDPDGDPLTYSWNFGDGSTALGALAAHEYSKKGVYFAVLTARDSHGGTASSASLRIAAGNDLPVVTITIPKPGRTLHLSENVRFQGFAIDPEDGPLPPENLLWNVKLYHNEHTHPFLNGVRGHSGSFITPPAFHGTGTLFFRIQLRAVDSKGLSNSSYVDIPWIPR